MEMYEPKEFEKEVFNSIVTHPLQSWEWGEFRKKTGLKVIRRISKHKKTAFEITIHKIPSTSFTLGYLPKSNLPDEEMINELRIIGNEQQCLFIKLEPNVEKISNFKFQISNFQQSLHPLFTKYTFQLDLTISEEELLKNMHSKTRYNIRLAQRQGVTVVEDNSQEAFENYIKLMHETTKRQQYYAHGEEYHRLMWETLKAKSVKREGESELAAHLLVAKYQEKLLVTWIVFLFNNVMYYPYGASTSQHKDVMASNLMMWEAIRFGKHMGCTSFDMWGSLGPDANASDPWYGFHRFKQGYNPRLVEFVGSYDLVLKPLHYQLYNLAHKVRWAYLRSKKRFG